MNIKLALLIFHIELIFVFNSVTKKKYFLQLISEKIHFILMAQQSPAVSYEKIDQELMKQPKDLVKVEQMLKSLNPALDDPEILWRLGSIHYYKSLEFDNEDEVKSRTLESFKFVQKAAKCFEAKSIDHFESNKWCAIVNGKLALLEIDPNDKVKYLKLLLE